MIFRIGNPEGVGKYDFQINSSTENRQGGCACGCGCVCESGDRKKREQKKEERRKMWTSGEADVFYPSTLFLFTDVVNDEPHRECGSSCVCACV